MVQITRVLNLPQDILGEFMETYRAMNAAKEAWDNAASLIGTVDPENQLEFGGTYIAKYQATQTAHFQVQDRILLMVREAGYNPANGDQAINFDGIPATGSVSWRHIEGNITVTPNGQVVARGLIAEDAVAAAKMESIIKTSAQVALQAVIAAMDEMAPAEEAESATETTEKNQTEA